MQRQSMPAIKTSANIGTNRSRAIFRRGSESAGAPLGPMGAARLLDEWIQRLEAESRRLGLETRSRWCRERARTTRMRTGRCN
jgi:hypothetical protein